MTPVGRDLVGDLVRRHVRTIRPAADGVTAAFTFGLESGHALGYSRSARSAAMPTASADVAQLVERNLAKVEVAGSSPVIRSDSATPVAPSTGDWRSGSALP